MVLFSTLRKTLASTANLLLTRTSRRVVEPIIKRKMGGHGEHKMVIDTTDFPFKKAVDMFHWYSCISLAIYGSIILYCNVFIGDGELREIPEGYVPKYWEYYEHPIQRFIAWMHGDPQKKYESFLHHLDHDYWDLQLSYLEDKIKFEMKKHKDYKAYYYRAISANTLRHYREESTADGERMAMDHRNYSFPADFKDDGEWPEPRGSS